MEHRRKGRDDIIYIYIYLRTSSKRKETKDTKENGVAKNGSATTLAGEVPAISVHPSASPILPSKTFKSYSSTVVHAVLVVTQCIGIHFKGGAGWTAGPGRSEGARSSSTIEGRETSRTGAGKEEDSGEKARRAEGGRKVAEYSRAAALYDDGSFTQ